MGKRKRRAADSDSSEASSYHQSADERDSDASHSEDEGTPKTPKRTTRQRITRKSATNNNNVGASPTKGAGTLLATLNLLEEPDQAAFPSSSPVRAGSPVPQRSPKKPPGSPRKKQKTNQTPIPPAKPESEWRKTDIPKGLEVTKGNAQKLFHVTAADIDASGIKFRTENRSRGLAGVMHLYQMRDVQRVAWGKHGSPEGYDTHIQNQKELWLSRGKDPLKFIAVPRPFRYERAGRCKQCQTSFSMPTHMIIDKCDPCRGIIRKPYTLLLPFDLDEYHGAYDEEREEEYDEEREEEYEGYSDPGCKYSPHFAGCYY